MTEQRARKVSEILNSLRKVLLKVNRFAGGQLAKEEEVKEALVEIYVRLLEFWVRLGKELRKDPNGKVDESPSTVSKLREKENCRIRH